MFKLLKKLVLWPPVLVTVVWLALLALCWLLIPALLSGWTVEARETVFLGLAVGSGLLWAFGLAVTLWRALRRNGLSLPSLPRRAARAGQDPALDALRAERDQALTALRSNPESASWPRIAIIGPSGSGKSSALLRCGQAPTRLDGRSTPYQPRPDERCAWVRCGQGIYLDTPGRLVDDDGARDLWRAILSTLREADHDPPLDGIVVVVGLSDLLEGRHGAEPRVLAERLRNRLDDAVEILGQAPPFHLLLTHLDGIAGLSDCLQDLDVQHAGRPLGRVVEMDGQGVADGAAEARKTIEDVVLRLERRAMQAMAGCPTERVGHALLAPAQLAHTRTTVEALVGHLTRRTGREERAPMAGIWLTGARGGGAEADLVSPVLDARWRLSPGLSSRPGAASRPSGGREVFLSGLFTEIFPRIAGDGALTRRELQRKADRAERGMRWILAALLLVALLLGTLGVLNLRYLRGLERRWEALVATLELEKPGRLPEEALSAELALLGTWGAPGWRFPDDATRERSLKMAGEDADAPPLWLSRIWLWPARMPVSRAVERRVLAHVEERLVGEAARLLREDLLRLSTTVPAPDAPEGTPTLEDWLVDAQASLELGRRWRSLYQEDAGGGTACADGLFTEDERELARWLARRLSLARASDRSSSLERSIADEDEAAELDAWLIGRLLEQGTDQCSSMARLVPAAAELAPLEAKLAGVKPEDAVFALLLTRVGREVDARLSHDPSRPRLGAPTQTLRHRAPLEAAPDGYDLGACQGFQLQLYLLEHSVGERLMDKGEGLLQGGMDGIKQAIRGGSVTAEPLVTWGEIERLVGELPTDEQRRKLLRELRGRYEASHARLWRDRWLALLEAPDHRTQELQRLGLDDLAEEIRALYGPQGAMQRTLSLLGRGQPSYLQTADGVDAGQREANNRCNALAATWRGAHGLADTDSQSSANAAWVDLTTKMLDLASALESAPDAEKRSKLVMETYGGDSELTSAWLALAGVRRQLMVLPSTPYNVSDPTSAELSPEDASRRIAEDLVVPVSQSALFLVWGHLLQEYEQKVEADWRAEILPGWSDLKATFPFTPSAEVVMDAGAVAELFGEGGSIDGFLEGRLSPWVPTGATQLSAPEPLGPEAPALSPGADLSGLVNGRRSRWKTVESLSKPLEFRLTPADVACQSGKPWCTTGPISQSCATAGPQEACWRWETPTTWSMTVAWSDPARVQVRAGDQRQALCADTEGVGQHGRAPLNVLQVFGRNAWRPQGGAHNFIVLTPGGFVSERAFKGKLLDPCQMTWYLDEDGRGPVSLYHALRNLGAGADLLNTLR